MTAWLQTQGYPVERKRVTRFLRLMGIEAIYPKPRLSLPGNVEQRYPYLLRGMNIERCNQVWSCDITYIRLRSGFIYLMAVIDWYSRYVLSWLRHEVASVAVEADKTGFNLVFHHQYLTEACVGSNSGVGSSRNNVPSLMRGRWNREGKS